MALNKDESAQKNEYFAEIRKYFSDEYSKTLNLDLVEDKTVKEYLKKADMSHWSHKNRIIRNIQILKHNFVTNKTDMITTCFKVSFDSTSCIYAYIHSRWMPKGRGGHIDHQFVCTGPTYRSQDGEYRNRFIPWDQFNQIFVRYSSEIDEVEELVVRKVESRRMTFQTDFYYPIGCSYNKDKFEDEINVLRLPIRLYIIGWLYDFYNVHNKIVENHVNPAYQYIIYQPEDLSTFESILTRIGQSAYWDMQARMSCRYGDINSPDYNISEVRCGQKIFPLSAIEAIRTDDINFNVWREIYITNMTSNLVLNLISPSFPFINNWFYIQNAHGGLFDNMAMHDKYKHSEIADEVSTQLKSVDKYNYVSGDIKKGPVSNKFFQLSRNIHKAIIYADSDIKLTDLAVCMTSEYVGRTLRDIPSLIVNREFDPGLDLSFTDYEIFTKHMFEFVYSFYCMNSKIGIMHGDLHMNNATIYRLYTMFNAANVLYVKNPYAAYVVNDKTYIFKHMGLFSMIIDFSRAIIGDYKKLEHEFSARFAEMYFKEQRTRVMHMIYHYFPKLIAKYHDKIDALLGSNFPLMFKILTAVDTFVIMSNIAAMFGIDDAFTRGKIKIAPGAIKLLQKLALSAEHLVTTNIQAAIEGRIGSADDIEWPNLIIIRKVFSDNLLTPAKMKEDITVVEIFNSNNDVIYDTEDYDTWGPLLSLEKEIELKCKYKQPIHGGIKRWVHYKQHDESETIDKLTSKYEQREKDVLSFEPWMLY